MPRTLAPARVSCAAGRAQHAPAAERSVCQTRTRETAQERVPRARGQRRSAHATRAPGAPARAAQRSVRRRRLTHQPTRGSRRCALERRRQSVLHEEGPPVPVALTVTLHRCTGVHYKRRRNTKACNRRYVRYSDPRGAYEIPRVYAACCATAGSPAWGLRAEEGGAMKSRQQGLALQSLGLWCWGEGGGEGAERGGGGESGEV